MSSPDRQIPDIGLRIKIARKEVGMTQVQLAEATGQAERTVQAWEANFRTPRTNALLSLAAALGRDPSWFYESQEEAA